MDTSLYFATNRGHEGANRYRPDRYGKRFSSDGMENLRFGRLVFQTDPERVAQLLNTAPNPQVGPGDGESPRCCPRLAQRHEGHAGPGRRWQAAGKKNRSSNGRAFSAGEG